MLNNHTEEIRQCYQQAAHCVQQAEAQNDPKVQKQFLELTRRWQRDDRDRDGCENVTPGAFVFGEFFVGGRSAFAPKADIGGVSMDVCFVPKSDLSSKFIAPVVKTAVPASRRKQSTTSLSLEL
jgi:hypothetical protein